jgi:methylenetetrahydrofolate dehydrogenase (NADP+)/methenyltetrahydrofolate cyclohydrolase
MLHLIRNLNTKMDTSKYQMDTHIIDGRQIAADLCLELADRITQLPFRRPTLKVILIGDDPASLSYVKSKTRVALQVGIAAETIRLPDDITKIALIKLIHELNHDPMIDGIMVQLPLPSHIDAIGVLNAIDPIKDVDGLAPHNRACHRELSFYLPCTPMGIMRLLRVSQTALQGAKAVMVGNGMVGQPTATLLSQANATVTTTTIYTRNLANECANADILVIAVGCPNLIRGSWIKPGVVIIDVGFNRVAGKITGDVAFDECWSIAGAITPVPGGVGPMTIACLMENTIEAARHSMVKEILQFF